MTTANNGQARPEWHTRSVAETIAAMSTTEKGLTAAEAADRLERHGANVLPEPLRPGLIRRFLAQFHNVLIYVLLGAALITAVLGHWPDTAVILAVVVVNAVIGFLQEGKAEKAMEAIRGMLAPYAAVLRDGERRSLASRDLVPGDVVLLEAGDKVPADLRLIAARGFQVQEAMLTGESVPVDKHTEPVDAEAPLGERFAMAYSGTIVTAGQARGVVVASAADTEVGRISGMIAEVETLTTPLVRQMDVFARWLTIFILAIAALLLVFGHYAAGYPFTEIFLAVVGLSVAAIPEGLPAVLTITLAVGVQAMARRNAIVRRLPAIETLGSVSVICTDKTGTLTRNEMSVVSVATPERFYTLDGIGYEPRGAIRVGGEAVDGTRETSLSEIALAALLCNDAALSEHGEVWSVEGDPMEGALLSFAGKAGFDVHRSQASWTRTDTIPFDSRHCFMATLHHDHEGQAFAFVKGAPERVLELCNTQRDRDGGTVPLDPDYWHRRTDEIAALGQRVLAFAALPLPSTHTVLEFADVEGAIFLGLTGMIDPPRPEAIEAVAECHAAGIRVKMITGDHGATALAIAREIGLRNADAVLTGNDIDAIGAPALAQAVFECDVFARTSPEHKLRLVEALQSHGLTVAMTGDGVNDAPALKRADAGIAMGRKGSEAAREAAELVLADDNFASIAAAVREGRTGYDNIKEVISWTLPTNAGEAMTIIVALVAGMTLPVTPIQILWVNLITAVTLGIALAFEPTEPRTMKRPPRPRDEPLLSSDLVWHVGLVSMVLLIGVFGLFRFAVAAGYPLELARTIALNALVVMEIFHLFFIRNFRNVSLSFAEVRGTPVIWATVGVVVLAQLAITYLPPLQAVFETRAVPLGDGLMILGAGVALFVVIEVEKQLRLRFGAKRHTGG